FNPSNQTIDLTNWTIVMNDSTSNSTPYSVETLLGTINSGHYKVILNPEGSLNNNGQIMLYNNLGQLIDSVTYGAWDDGNLLDNAPDGNADSYLDECLARIPNGQDTNIDSVDFIKTECTYGLENIILLPNEQTIGVIIAGKIVFKVFPRNLDFGIVQQSSTNNSALNGPITFDVNGSTTDVNVEITNVTGFPFEEGLKIDGHNALGSSWLLICLLNQGECNFNPVWAFPTLDVPEDAQPGNNKGTITYTVTGPPPQ
ncbi:MAG: lamin tail domain-containing protein, partial [Nanoarchaeota archaeon]|nr:lamin tail domain-containing protein [Nanoarchaeota archaeon]